MRHGRTIVFMMGPLILAAFLSAIPQLAAAQTTGVLHIKVTLVDASQASVPVAEHALLISDNPATAPPRRVVTGPDGVVDVRLRPGNYTVESDDPFPFAGKGYEWVQTIDVAATKQTVLDLTAKNADIVPITVSTRTASPAPAAKTDASSQALAPLQNSVVRLWSPTSRSSGFLVDPRGLVATNQRSVGTATTVEVELARDTRVEGRVLAADPALNVAILWIDPGTAATLHPVTTGCSGTPATVTADQEIFALGVSLRQRQDHTEPGVVSGVQPHAIASDLSLDEGGTGGPAFTADGTLIGLTAFAEDQDARRREWQVVPVADLCQVLQSAEPKMQNASPPGGRHLPLEPTQTFPVAALTDMVKKRAGNLSPYQLAASDFNVAFVTPVMVFAANQPDRHTTSRDMRLSSLDQARMPSPTDFANWSEYLESTPPVLLIRVTPKLVENFWTTVARGAAVTQGMALPAFKHFKPPLSRMRVQCGEADVKPIHALVLESPVMTNETVHEALYVFDPSAIGPNCGTVKLTLYTEKDPEHGDTRTVDPAVLKQIWQDFEPLRTP